MGNPIDIWSRSRERNLFYSQEMRYSELSSKSFEKVHFTVKQDVKMWCLKGI